MAHCEHTTMLMIGMEAVPYRVSLPSRTRTSVSLHMSFLTPVSHSSWHRETVLGALMDGGP